MVLFFYRYIHLVPFYIIKASLFNTESEFPVVKTHIKQSEMCTGLTDLCTWLLKIAHLLWSLRVSISQLEFPLFYKTENITVRQSCYSRRNQTAWSGGAEPETPAGDLVDGRPRKHKNEWLNPLLSTSNWNIQFDWIDLLNKTNNQPTLGTEYLTDWCLVVRAFISE